MAERITYILTDQEKSACSSTFFPGGAIAASDSNLLQDTRTQKIVAALNSDEYVRKGVYTVVGYPQPEFVWATDTPRLFPVTPRSGTPVGENASPEDVLSRDICFREKTIQRDRVCVVTGEQDLNLLRGCHIVPFAWKKNNVVSLLPANVRDHIFDIDGIDTVRNGFLALGTLHDHFDQGFWGVVTDNGVPRFFGISRGYRAGEHHGRALRLPEGRFPNGESYADYFPSATLWEHHFRCSVFAHMRGSGDQNEDPDREGEAEAMLATELAEIDASLEMYDGTPLADSVKKIRGDVVKEVFGGLNDAGVPMDVPSAYI
ncbi:hypothetical protein PhCBS80983_g05813 [Powellomyces hirtus]|uniref:HNH nuclease domain-containing protein n=1 Tax=Powellomyces hirtus TaxID=109895 RepID=A0A507DUS9_9FUNG|nr:hypothetical protein PhCBS80983_g05813 [Powellomyces hirtus]